MRSVLMMFAGLALMMAPLSTSAAPLDPAHLPADAKWVLHMDFEAFGNTLIAERIREKKPGWVAAAGEWMNTRYGIDLKKDLYGLTMFSDTYEAHSGVGILFADYDMDKIRKDLRDKPGISTTEWQGNMLYTVKKRELAKPMTIVLREDSQQVVFASSPERAKAAVMLLNGKGKSLKGKDSPLVGDVPQGSVAYGAAIELQRIARRDGVFPILRQHEQVKYSVGNDGEYVFENVELVGASEEVAQEMKTCLDGAVAFLNLWAADSKPLMKLAKEVEITRDGRKVASQFRTEVKNVENALDAIRQRIKQWQVAAKN